MVVKRKLNCGSNGFDFPNIPKAPRSSRMKVSNKRSDDDGQICAIDLLASLAGKLLEESASSSTFMYAFEGDNHDHLGGVIKKQDGFNKPCKLESSDQGNLASKSTSENTNMTCLTSLEQAPVSDCKKALGFKSLIGTEEKCLVNVDTGSDQGEATGGLTTDTFNLKDPCQLHSRSPESVHLDGDVKLAQHTDCVPNCSFEGYGNHNKLVCRDDDEKHCKYYRFSENCKSYRSSSLAGYRRIKKSGMKKYGRAVSSLRCFEDTRTDGRLKALYRKRKLCNGYKTWKRETIHRKRSLSDKGLVVNYDGGFSSESVSNSPKKGESENGNFSSAIGLLTEDSCVKFSIKSLRIPELVIEVPETATVGLLKRTVKEAVTALFDGGIHIGMLVQGKKVRDDNSVLSETGFSRENLGKLDFTVEPGPETLNVPLCSENPIISMPTDSTDLTERSATLPALELTIAPPLQDADHLMNSGNSVENNLELVPYQNDITADEQPSSDSRALVPFSALESETVAIIPVKEKLKRTELSRRRTRRPFSVMEVEALVQAVEKLGTGRWRDVKLRSFTNASHRTYVDLKDKWKTLVHTASISPQQRRGEPVPQELLDRVLAAHNHWSQHQTKQNGKHQVVTTMMVQAGSSM